MQAELTLLENKLTQLVQLSQRLRLENINLRQELAQALSENRHCQDKIDTATARLEQLLVQLPDEHA